MKKYLVIILTTIVVLTLSVLGFVLGGVNLSQNQLDTLLILGIICGASALYCFVVGELAHNNSQMDKLWSILPIAYVWVIAAKGGLSVRLIVFAIIVTFWGARLTFNFARKGAYTIKFWAGEEDYRWSILRKNKMFQNRLAWGAFDLFFISIYQNALVLCICLPALAVMDSSVPFGSFFDIFATVFASLFLILETVADEEQWVFQTKKHKFLKEGKSLEELDEPYNKGFNTRGLWGFMRHPNYLGEQGIWLSLYFFTLGGGAVTYGVFNWTLFAPLFLIFLFLGSSNLGEAISGSKYPEYEYYVSYVYKYLPVRKYNYEKAKAKFERA